MFEYSDFYDFDSSDEEDEELDEGSVGEMVLKDGSVIGHRSMWKYFKQSFNPKTDLVLSKRQRQISGYRYNSLLAMISRVIRLVPSPEKSMKP